MDAPSGTLAEGRLGLAVGSLFALPIGVLSGFTGVGGGEYRAPVLLALLGRVRWAIAANLLIGLCVAVFNVVFRQAWTLDLDLLWLALLFVPTSLPGAFVGALVTRRISTKALKGLLAGILVATGLRLILFEVRAGGALSFGLLQIGLGLLLGFGLGILSGLLGVAGGEYRIPAFVLLFGVPTVFAGTLSSLASIPLQFMGFWKHRNLGHTGAATFRLGALMGVVSVVGVALGVLFLGRATEALVTQVLGLAMILAAVRIVWDIRHPHPSERPSISEGA
ncbi:MAG: sulfite exporter TauE/SafE family protein [Methanobacteriota archaeon]|nr:MAG: sulfite exporter TauE/SafE family protein [Euryarchaeota archaeon]